jgi:hypothetical protein
MFGIRTKILRQFLSDCHTQLQRFHNRIDNTTSQKNLPYGLAHEK